MDTESNKGKQVSPLGEVELEVMRMWFEAYTSGEIEKALKIRFGERGPSANMVRAWLCRGGKLCEFYKEYAKTEGEYRNKETRQAFRAHIKNAARVLVQIMNDPLQPAPSRVKAAEDIINRELGEPIKVVANLEKNPAREILEELGVIDKDSKQNDE
jgi:hypothetical protein